MGGWVDGERTREKFGFPLDGTEDRRDDGRSPPHQPTHGDIMHLYAVATTYAHQFGTGTSVNTIHVDKDSARDELVSTLEDHKRFADTDQHAQTVHNHMVNLNQHRITTVTLPAHFGSSGDGTITYELVRIRSL